jgi:hypothetical protein
MAASRVPEVRGPDASATDYPESEVRHPHQRPDAPPVALIDVVTSFLFHNGDAVRCDASAGTFTVMSLNRWEVRDMARGFGVVSLGTLTHRLRRAGEDLDDAAVRIGSATRPRVTAATRSSTGWHVALLVGAATAVYAALAVAVLLP